MPIIMKKVLATLFAVALGLNLSAQDDCEPSPDLNQDGVVGMNDLLTLLTAFGDFDMDFDGIWDSVDDCVGAYDECGICNGEGVPCPCVGPVEFDSFAYNLVQINGQCWFKENLRTEVYSNGDSVGLYISAENWTTTSQGAMTVYGQGDAYCSESTSLNSCDEAVSLEMYGRLYNGFAVLDERGICPEGWRVPTDFDWQQLESFLGMSEVDLEQWGHVRGIDVQAGLALKAQYGWYANGNGNDSLGFSALPGGGCHLTGYFVQAGDFGRWWTSTVTTQFMPGHVITRNIDRNAFGISRDPNDLNDGRSVRCVRD